MSKIKDFLSHLGRNMALLCLPAAMAFGAIASIASGNYDVGKVDAIAYRESDGFDVTASVDGESEWGIQSNWGFAFTGVGSAGQTAWYSFDFDLTGSPSVVPFFFGFYNSYKDIVLYDSQPADPYVRFGFSGDSQGVFFNFTNGSSALASRFLFLVRINGHVVLRSARGSSADSIYFGYTSGVVEFILSTSVESLDSYLAGSYPAAWNDPNGNPYQSFASRRVVDDYSVSVSESFDISISYPVSTFIPGGSMLTYRRGQAQRVVTMGNPNGVVSRGSVWVFLVGDDIQDRLIGSYSADPWGTGVTLTDNDWDWSGSNSYRFDFYFDVVDDSVFSGSWIEGYAQGSSDGYAEGYSSGYASGYSDGSYDAYQEGYSSGYSAGDSAGYRRGYGDGSPQIINFTGILAQILSAPFTFIVGSMDFTFFQGTPYAFNFGYFFWSLFALSIAYGIFKLIFGFFRGGK